MFKNRMAHGIKGLGDTKLVFLIIFSTFFFSNLVFAGDSVLLQLSDDAVSKIENSGGSKSGFSVYSTGVPSLNTLNSKTGAVGFKRVFPYAGRFEEQHKQFGLHKWYKVSLPTGSNMDSVVSVYEGGSSVERAEVNKEVEFFGTPNDLKYTEGYLWNYKKISLPEAWDTEVGNPSVIVAVIDTGIDLNHPDLVKNIWKNPGEIPGNGVDDDNNGYVDDVHGWDFRYHNNDQTDTYFHGTHCSGIIAASTNNGIGVSGVAGGWGDSGGVKLMALKTSKDSYPYSSPQSAIAEALVYAADNGAIISSNSYGCTNCGSKVQRDAFDYFETNAGHSGGLSIAGAGNDDSDSKFYPAAYPNVIAVAATTFNDERASFSNYGSWIDVLAPGAPIMSTTPTYKTDAMSKYGHSKEYAATGGTSMSCPHVAGLAALIASVRPDLSGQQIRDVILKSADSIDGLNPGFEGKLGSGRINAKKALDALEKIPFKGGVYIDEEKIEPKVLLYDGVNYGPETLEVSSNLCKLTELYDSNGNSWNDRFSSMKVGLFTKAILYEHIDYSGLSKEFTSDDHDLRANGFTGFWEALFGYDMLSSIKVMDDGSTVRTYKGDNSVYSSKFTVPNGVDYTFESGGSVDLNPGFLVEDGANFQVKIN